MVLLRMLLLLDDIGLFDLQCRRRSRRRRRRRRLRRHTKSNEENDLFLIGHHHVVSDVRQTTIVIESIQQFVPHQ